MSTEYIELKKLVKSPLNARKTVSKTACEELKASILAHGLMQNLVVTDASKGKYHVIAGARRLEALKALQKDGLFAPDYTVPCQIVGDEHAAEMSLAENVVRQAMHPADQFEAFAALIDGGHAAAQVAVRFGVSERLVEQRMRLARVAPELLAEYRAEKLTLDALTAFTVTDDHRKQLAVYESLAEWELKRPDTIRRHLTEEMLNADDKLAKFVTLEAYQAAGGTVKTDLFGDDVYLENPELLHSMVREKLALAEKELLAEGWMWALAATERDWQVMQGHSRIQPEEEEMPAEVLAELEKLESEQSEAANAADDAAAEDDQETYDAMNEKIDEIGNKMDEITDSFKRFTPDQMKNAGCYAYIAEDGGLVVEKGLVNRDDAKKTAQKATGATDSDEPAPKAKGLPQSLLDDLATHRMQAAKVAIASNPAIAFDLMVYTAACRILGNSFIYDGADIQFNPHLGSHNVNRTETPAGDAHDAIRAVLPVEWLKAKDDAARFEAFRELTADEKHRLLAYCVSDTLRPNLDDGKPTAYDIALAQTGMNVADYWRPTKDNFLSRVTSQQLLEIGQEIFGGNFSAQYAKAKKSELVTLLDKGFTNPEKAMDREKVSRLMRWLPAGMAFGRAETAKGKKAA